MTLSPRAQALGACGREGRLVRRKKKSLRCQTTQGRTTQESDYSGCREGRLVRRKMKSLRLVRRRKKSLLGALLPQTAQGSSRGPNHIMVIIIIIIIVIVMIVIIII